MMKGPKRLAVSESNSDSAFRNKRIMAGSSLDVDWAEPSQEQSIGTPPLDAQRAASSQQHVKALNTQFASWVQTQLNNHPYQLWEDGLRDYLTHASNIMEKFSDVVSWLKVNASKGENLAASGPCTTAEKKAAPESTNSETKSFQTKTLSSPVGTTASFATSWNSGVFSSGQSSAGLSSNPSSTGVSSNSQTTSGVFSSQSSTVFSSSQPSGIFSSSQYSGSDQNKTQSSSIFSHSQSPGVFSNSQSSGAFSNTPNFGLFSNGPSSSSSQSTVVFPTTPSFGLFSNSQSSSSSPSSMTFSNTPNFGLFANSQNSGLSSNNQPPSSFGIQSSVPARHDGSEQADAEDDLEQPSSPSVKKSEEKGVVVVHEVKCKLYVKSSDPEDKDTWKDKGTGQLSIKCKEGVSKGTKESQPQIIVRNDVGRVQLNALLYSGIKTNLQKNSIVAIFHTAGEGDGNDGNGDSVAARTFLIRLKTQEDRNKLATAIQEYAPAS